MARSTSRFTAPIFSKRVIVIVGGYGSGKSEVAVNLAQLLALNCQSKVAIADLDIVNPYFRSREASERLNEFGIESINPRGDFSSADLPIILPEIAAAVESYDGTLILDAGGDDVGSRVLSSLTVTFPADDYEMLLVLNSNRPFTQDVPSCQNLMREIETATRLKFTGIIANSHMLHMTDITTIIKGLDLAKQVSTTTGLPVNCVAVDKKLLSELEQTDIEVPVLPLHRLLLKPWEREDTNSDSSTMR